jgi:hypothetical protein
LLQAPKVGGGYLPIEYQPDHPHEGECIEPRTLNEKLLPGIALDEFPLDAQGGRPPPKSSAADHLAARHHRAEPAAAHAPVASPAAEGTRRRRRFRPLRPRRPRQNHKNTSKIPVPS